VKLKYTIAGTEIEYSINRNFQNIEIAHRMYVELITRKAAIPIDENDVIVEVYNSWYTLFQTTRDELKKLSGEMLLDNQVSKDLIKLLSDILNKGLRPHLTEHQAKFRKWYNFAITSEDNKDKTPQKIQSEYDDYDNLFKSIKSVNELLIEYSKRLDEIVNGNKNVA
jgi:translation initiation factor 2 beta subunit (eIF-2beta)/eIF-5